MLYALEEARDVAAPVLRADADARRIAQRDVSDSRAPHGIDGRCRRLAIDVLHLPLVP